MKFLLDANMPKSLVRDLAQKYGVECSRIYNDLSDDEIYDNCKAEKKVLLTLDTDFLNILRYPPHQHPGIVVFRIRDQSLAKVKATVFDFFETFKNQWQLLKGNVVVVREDRYKVYSEESSWKN